MRDKHDSERLPKIYYEALGRLLVAFQALEGEVTYALVQLSQPQRNSEIEIQYFLALESMPFKVRIKLLRSFAATRSPKYYLWPGCPMEAKRKEELPGILHEFKVSLVEAVKLEDERNAIVHSEWRLNRKRNSRIVTRHKTRIRDNGVQLVKEEVPIEKLHEMVERMQEIRQDISATSQLLSLLLAEKCANQKVESVE